MLIVNCRNLQNHDFEVFSDSFVILRDESNGIKEKPISIIHRDDQKTREK